MEPATPPWGRQALLTSPVLLLVAAVLVGEAAAPDPPSTSVLVVDGLLGLGSWVALPWVVRRPVRGAAALAALSLLAPTVTPAAATGVLWVARREPLRTALLLAGAAIGAQAGRGWWRPDLGLPTGWWALVVALSYLGLVGWGAWAQARGDLLASRLEAVRQAERARIAREVHDTLGHRLSLVATLAGALEYNTSARPEQVAEATAALRTAAHGALEDLREAVGVLRVEDREGPGPERPQPSLADLATLVEDGRRAGATIVLDDEIAPDDLASVPVGAGRTAYRLVQEGLTNARRHAPGQPVHIGLRGQPGEALEVEVSNPFNQRAASAVGPGGGAGMVGLRERVELVGGRFDHGPSSSGRYRTVASLPWPG